MDSLAPHRTVVAPTLDEPRLQTRRRRLVVLIGLGVMLLAFALMAVSASAAQAYTVSGTVTAQATHLGIAEAAVTVTEPATGIEVASTTTNFAGSYSLEVPAGTYDISFTPPVGSGYTPVEDRGEAVLANRTIDVEFTPLSGSVTFSGVLFGGGGVPLPGVAITLGNESVNTGSDGSFSMTVAPGTYELGVTGYRAAGVPAAAAPGYFSFSGAQVTVDANVQQDLTLPVHVLTVRTLGSGGTAIPEVFLRAHEGSSLATGTLAPGISAQYASVDESATTAEDGTAMLTLPSWAGSPTAEAVPPANTPLVRTPFSIAGIEEDQEREVQMLSGVTFSGVLFGGGGVPLPGVAITLGNESVNTGSDGSFSMTVAPGTYELGVTGYRAAGVPAAAAPGYFSFSGAQVTVDANVQQDLTLPVHVLTVRTLGSGGTAIPEVFLRAHEGSSLATGTLAPGISAQYASVDESATTAEDGTAMLTLPNWAGSPTAEAVPPANTPLVRTPFSIAGIEEDQEREVQMLSGVTFSGVLFGGGGVPLPGVAITLGNESVNTGSDGSFSMTVAPGTYELGVTGYRAAGVPAAAAPGYFSFSGAQVTVDANVQQDLTLPVHVLTVRTLGSGGTAIPEVFLRAHEGSSLATGTLAPGISAQYASVDESATTAEDGTAMLTLPSWAGSPTAEAVPPANTPLVRTPFSIAGIEEDQTRIVAFPYFAKVASAGTSTGTVEIASPPETTLSAVSDEQAKEAGLPEGAVAVVGSVSYTVSELTPGGSTNVTMQLPPGSEPTNVFKLINGSYIDVTSLATISGNTITLHLTDGGLGDADGVANGVIVDPVVPVRITKHAQTISFSSAAPPKPAIGGKYTVEATASSGLPVSFSIDGASTAGACSVSTGTVSFTGVGTCVIDANQAGSETYLPAPQQQQTVEVVKASQTISFTTTAPSNPNVGSVYAIAASATSGLPVSYSVDKASQKGACKISGTTVSFTGAGSCVIDANQSGDATYLAAPRVQQTMAVTAAQASTTTTMVLTAPSAVYGSEQTDVAKVAITAAGGGTIPTGKIAVMTGTKTLCKATISNGAGSCMLGPKVLNPGVYPVVAVYTATTHFGASTSSSSTLTVTKDPTSTALSLSAASVAYGSEQTEIFNVTVTAGGGIAPSGSVKIKAGTKTVCTATLTAGVGTCSPKETTLPRGNYKVEAVYAGSLALEPSVSSSTNLTVS